MKTPFFSCRCRLSHFVATARHAADRADTAAAVLLPLVLALATLAARQPGPAPTPALPPAERASTPIHWD